jgi:glutamate 5-kinase
VRGQLIVDAGCAEALQMKKNLYAAGIIGVQGDFGVMDAVDLVCSGTVVARGLTNYSSNVCHCTTSVHQRQQHRIVNYLLCIRS